MKPPFYLEAVYKSIIDMRWLQARRHDGARAGKYFLGVLLIVAMINAIVITRFTLTILKESTKKIVQAAPNLILEKKNNRFVASGITEPFIYETSKEKESLFLYIDTTTSSAAVSVSSVFTKKESVLLAVIIHNDGLRFIDGESGKEHIILAADLPNNSLISTGKTFAQMADIIERPGTFFILFSFMTLAMFVFYAIAQAAYLALLTLIVWCIVRLKRVVWTYSELFTVGMFAGTLPLIVGEILPLFGWYVPFVASIVWLGILASVAFKKFDGEKVESGDEA